MRPPPAKIGQRLTDVLTPALMISMPVLEKNEAAMRAALRGSGVALRPHFKAQKSSACAKWLQKQAGSELAGLCAQTLTEAEVLLRSGATPSCLLTNEVIGPAATARAAALAVDYPGVLSVLADCEAGVAGLSAAAVSAGAAELAVLVEVDCGQDRCGVDSSRAGAVAALAQAIVDAPGLRFGGLHVYHGAIQHVRTVADREAEVAKGPKAVAARCLAELKAAGIDSVPVVTGGGTGTFELDVASGTHTEVQPGSYLFMDGDYGRNADTPSKFAQSLYVHTTVISAARGKRVVDAGSKAVDLLSGVPKAVSIDGAAPPGLDAVVFSSGGDEHGVLRGDALDDDAVLPVGSTLQLVPGHCDPTVNMYNEFVCVRDGVVEDVWPIDARGPG